MAARVSSACGRSFRFCSRLPTLHCRSDSRPIRPRPACPRRHRRVGRPLRHAEEGGRELQGPVPVPRREVAQLHRQRHSPDLPLLRLRRARRCDPLPVRAPRHGLCRRGHRPRPASGHAGARGRRSSAEERAEAARKKAQSTTLSDILAKAAEHYKAQLKASPRAIEYLKGRGLSGEIAARFALGGPRGLAHAGERVPALRRPAAGRVRHGDRVGRGPGHAEAL